MDFSNSLINWYLNHKRDLPWRNSTNSYHIWLSEIILQQTRVAQGLPYYESFLKNFPTVFDLAKADEQQVLKLWQGLGYYSRARNLHKTSKIVAHEMNGIFPDNYNELLKLKGIGTYTAAAIASFAYNEAVPVVDGNVFRFLARYFNLETDIGLNSSKKIFSDLAFELMPKNNPAQFNQAMMEFGALQCVPKNPNCDSCIFNSSCAALQYKKVSVLPFKSKKIVVKNRFLNYLIYIDKKNNTKINQRTENGIWKNLYEFPLIETMKTVDLEYIASEIKSIHQIISISEFYPNEIIHKLTHQKLHIKFWIVSITNSLENGIHLEKISDFPFPIVIYNFIEKWNETNLKI